MNSSGLTFWKIGNASLKRTMTIPIKNIKEANAKLVKIHLYNFSFISSEFILALQTLPPQPVSGLPGLR